MQIILVSKLAVVLLASFITACGGGGVSAQAVTNGDSNTTTTTTTTTTTATVSTPSVQCAMIGDSLTASTTGTATYTCDNNYAYIASNGLATHPMMTGITATNLNVPLASNYSGTNTWKIPLQPLVVAVPTNVTDGAIGIAINGVPIFNPCKQGGCQQGDTKALGELDTCNGHAGRGDDYHYHAAPTCLMATKPANYWDTHPIGWALDGFAIFGYNNSDGTVATRDSVCGGNTSTVVNGPAGYSYHVTDSSPYILSCLRGTPSKAARAEPVRQPPVIPFQVSGMTLTTDAASGYQVLQFSSARSFETTATVTDKYPNAPGSYKIRYKSITGDALKTLLASNIGRTACWNFQFTNSAGATTQPDMSYCR